MLGVGSTTVKRWANENRLPYIRTAGGHRRFRRSVVEWLLRKQTTSSHDPAAADKWICWLSGERNVNFIREEITRLHEQLGDWFAVADFLGGVVRLIGTRWADGGCSIVEEHIASGRLDQAVSAVSSSFQVPRTAPVCLLATLPGEQHALGLSLTQLCLRSGGIEVLWVGVNTPVDDLVKHVRTSDQRLLGLSASGWSTDYDFLAKAYRDISAACQDRGIELILGGAGAWPDVICYGYRCHSFGYLRSVLERLGLRPSPSSGEIP